MKVIKLNDLININNGLNFDHVNNLIGEVTISKYGSDGSLLYKKRDHNRILLPGSVFVLEQMFKPASRDSSLNKNIPISINTPISGAGTVIIADSWTAPSSFGGEKIFGFMVGNGGSNSTGTVATEYNKTSLFDSYGNNSIVPFRVVETTATQPIGYEYCATSGGYNFYLMKSFDQGHTPTLGISTDNSSVYATMRMSINAAEFKEYFALTGGAATVINQIGLVSGYFNGVKNRWDDVRLITTINFASLDIIGDSTYVIEYTIYSK